MRAPKHRSGLYGVLAQQDVMMQVLLARAWEQHSCIFTSVGEIWLRVAAL